MEETPYQRISAHVLLDGYFDVDNNFRFCSTMYNKIYDTEEDMRNKLILKINELGVNWHLNFNETPEHKFMISIHSESVESCQIIERIVLNGLKLELIDSINYYKFDINQFKR